MDGPARCGRRSSIADEAKIGEPSSAPPIPCLGRSRQQEGRTNCPLLSIPVQITLTCAWPSGYAPQWLGFLPCPSHNLPWVAGLGEMRSALLVIQGLFGESQCPRRRKLAPPWQRHQWMAQ